MIAVLTHIEQHAPITRSALETDIHVDKKILSRTLKQAQKQKLIEIKDNEVKLVPDWKTQLHLPANFALEYFVE